jgi:hypothetical protein
MKKLFVVVAVVLVAAVTGTTGCKKKKDDPKSSACNIESFTAGGKSWNISGTNITCTFDKGTIVTSLAPTIVISPKATVSPASGAAKDFTNSVTYTVVAEDGTKKDYTATATVSTVAAP